MRSSTAQLLSSLLLVSAAACATASPPLPRPSAAAAAQAQPEMAPTASAVGATEVADARTTDPDHYHLVMENQQVRVLRYHDVPGTKTHPHRHPASVLYALSSCRRRLHFPDGTSRDREFVAGDVMWIPAQTHVGENIGTTNTEVLLVELKP
jgi:quercetin dioxygenase-like cupin family protein